MSDIDTIADARTLSHPLRVSILLAMGEHGGEISPLAISERLGQPLGVVSYHVRYLHKVGAIELARTQAVRGVSQSFYVVAKASVLALSHHADRDRDGRAAADERAEHDFAALGRALMSQTRLHMLRALAEADRSMTPGELSKRLRKPLGAVSYHARYLQKLGYIDLARTELTRGSIAHYYALTPFMREFMQLPRQAAAMPA